MIPSSTLSTEPIRERVDRRLSAWIQLAALLSFAALAMPFFLGQVYVGDDLGEFHLPVRNFYAEQLRAGEPFAWMPSLYGGFYLAGEGQLGAYHPLHQVLYRFLPLGAAFDLELLLNYPFLFAGTFFLMSRWLRRRNAALFGALVFTFSSFSLLHFVHPNAIAVVAHIPWLLWAADVAIVSKNRRERAWAELAIGLLTASQLLLGYPQYVWFSLIVETAYVAWRVVSVHATIRAGAMWLLAKTLGALGGAIQLLPTMDALADSVRHGSDVAFANSGSLHPLNLIQLLAPYLFRTRVVGQNTHELALYAGAVPLLLCLWLVVHRRDWGRFAPLLRATFIFGGLALLLAAGEFGGIYRLQSWLPLVNHFRFPCRAIMLVQLCIAVNAAVALALLLDGLKRDQSTTEGPNDRPLLIAFLVSLALAIAGPLLWTEHVASMTLVFVGPGLIGIGAALIALAERGWRGATTGLVIFTAIDLCAYGLSDSIFGHTADLHEFVATVDTPPQLTRARIASTSDASGIRTGNRILLTGLARADGYAGLEPAKRLDYTQRAALQLAGVDWQLQRHDDSDQSTSKWTRIRPTAPRARLIAHIVSSDQLRDPKTIGMNAAVVDEPLDIPKADPGSVRVVCDKAGQITLDTEASTRQLLVTTESFHAGWRVMVDGRVQGVVRVNGDFLGCVVPAGRHQVVLQFRPRSLDWGAAVSACGLSLMVCMFWLRRRNVHVIVSHENA